MKNKELSDHFWKLVKEEADAIEKFINEDQRRNPEEWAEFERLRKEDLEKNGDVVWQNIQKIINQKES